MNIPAAATPTARNPPREVADNVRAPSPPSEPASEALGETLLPDPEPEPEALVDVPERVVVGEVTVEDTELEGALLLMLLLLEPLLTPVLLDGEAEEVWEAEPPLADPEPKT